MKTNFTIMALNLFYYAVVKEWNLLNFKTNSFGAIMTSKSQPATSWRNIRAIYD